MNYNMQIVSRVANNVRQAIMSKLKSKLIHRVEIRKIMQNIERISYTK